jgi:hypothetical protein
MQEMRLKTTPRFAGLFLLALLLSVAIYFGAVFTDETITEGGGYGFEINQTKRQSFKAAEDLFTQGTLAEMLAKQGGEFSQQDFLVPTSENFGQAATSNEWVLFYTSPRAFHNSVRLKFEDGILVSIWRYRLPFELP